MIFTCIKGCPECKVGRIVELTHPLPNLRKEKLMGKIIKECTREEFYNYWLTHSPTAFEEALILYGAPDIHMFFYEALID